MAIFAEVVVDLLTLGIIKPLRGHVVPADGGGCAVGDFVGAVGIEDRHYVFDGGFCGGIWGGGDHARLLAENASIHASPPRPKSGHPS